MATATESSPQALLAAATAVIDAYSAKDWDRARASIAPDSTTMRSRPAGG
ncbi:MAG TPA: hypothetical protein VJ794_03830 [Gemmatimonadales bacterium]|nr:hypothetical protein [Gemmatimonadales bacterium]